MICSILQSNKAPPLSMAIASRQPDASLFTLSPFPDNLLLIMEVFRTMKMIINGKRVDAASGETVEVLNPATGEVLDTVPVATQADIEAALDAARQGQKVWAKVPIYERIAILKRFRALLERDALAVSTMLTRELGKPLTQSTSETACTLNIIDNFCECARTLGGETYVPNNFSHSTGGDLVMTVREPIGVVACILPFNYPIELFVQKVVPALLMGNAVVIKPATDTPLANIRMAELLLEAGVAPEAVQLVTGSGARIGKWLCESPKIDCISLTGSTAVGIETARNAAAHLHEVGLELGGNDPLIIFDDCDLDQAVAEAVGGRFANSGQTCCASKRFIVQNSIKEAFTEKLVQAVSQLVVGDPFDEKTSYGPMVNPRALQDVMAQIKLTVEQGAKLLCGGEVVNNGVSVAPTVLGDVTREMSIANEMEIFGPVWPVIGFDTEEEAVELANHTPYGLSSGIITKDIFRALRMARQIDAGGVVLNGAGLYRTPEQPFGGYKSTGIGQEGGAHTLLSMSLNKTLILKGAFS